MQSSTVIAVIWFAYGAFSVLASSIKDDITQMGLLAAFASALSVGFGMVISHVITKSSSLTEISALKNDLSNANQTIGALQNNINALSAEKSSK